MDVLGRFVYRWNRIVGHFECIILATEASNINTNYHRYIPLSDLECVISSGHHLQYQRRPSALVATLSRHFVSYE